MSGPGAAPVEVVGAAIVEGDRALAARRTPRRPTGGGAGDPAGGRWEFPGGKVEPGEARDAALVREIGEELGCRVEVRGWLRGAAEIGETHVLRVAEAVVVTGRPVARADHDELRWLGPDELGDVDWLEPDRPFLGQVADLLRDRRRHLLGSDP